MAIAAVKLLWDLSLVAEGVEADRLAESDGRAWFWVWLSSVAGRFLALAIAGGALAVWLWEWLRHNRGSMNR